MKIKILNIILLLAVGVLLAACDSEGDKFDYEKVGLLITGTEQTPVQRFTVDELPAAYCSRKAFSDLLGLNGNAPIPIFLLDFR